MTSVLPYLLIVVFILFSAFFSGSEIAYASANRLRLKARAEIPGKGRAAKMALRIYDTYDEALVAILVGNNLVNMGASSVATVIAISLMGEGGAWIATAVMTVLILTFGEILPKILAASAADDFAVLFAMPLRAISLVFSPIVWLVQKILLLMERLWKDNIPEGPALTEDDLETILETVEDEGIMDEDRCDLLHSALDFGDVLAYEIITPRVDMLCIDMEDDIEDIASTLFSSPYSRLPVCSDGTDHIIGILHLNHVFKRLTQGDTLDKALIHSLLLPARFVHKTTPLDKVLAVMRRCKQHMVIVTDEYGGTMGMLTMEDVLEQLVGDIWDETDEINVEFQALDPAQTLYEVDGDMRIYDFFDALDMDDRDFDDDNTTLGGWCIEMLGRYPKVGDSFNYKNLTITVKRRRNMRVTRLLVRVHPLPEVEDEAY